MEADDCHVSDALIIGIARQFASYTLEETVFQLIFLHIP